LVSSAYSDARSICDQKGHPVSDIDAAKVKELRERTGAGMMDAKRALVETKGDMEKAADWLRSKGLAAAAKKAGRVAADGLVAVAVKGNQGAVVEINSETDFVARNDKFQDLVKAVAGVALASNGDYAKTSAAKFPGSSQSVKERVVEAVATIGENIQFRRSAGLSVKQGIVASYVHNAAKPDLGKIAVLVAVESSAPADKLAGVGKQVAMHVAAANPQAVTPDALDKVLVARERAVFEEQSRASGKPPEIIAKMVEGRLRKFYGEVVLMEQLSVMDNETKISKVIEDAGKAAGAPVKVTGFVRYALGEGIEKKQEDFAAEVAAATKH
jgi:elongation factor Ts